MVVATTEIIVIGGSAGSLSVLLKIIKLLPDDFSIPIVVVVHRQRNVISEFTKILASANKNKKIIEPDDKEPIKNACIYIAPQNYHLLIETDLTFSLDYSEAVKFSRPSIDVTLEAAADVYKEKLLAILLSGANNDGTAGLKKVLAMKGIAIAQEPNTAEFAAMPQSAIDNVPGVLVFEPSKIEEYIKRVNFLFQIKG